MTPDEFINSIQEQVINETHISYRQMIESSQTGTDPVWQRAKNILKELNSEKQEYLMKLIKQVQIDTVSHVLGIIDGTSYFSAKRPGFILRTDESDQPLNGDLQDLFLARNQPNPEGQRV